MNSDMIIGEKYLSLYNGENIVFVLKNIYGFGNMIGTVVGHKGKEAREIGKELVFYKSSTVPYQDPVDILKEML